MLELDKNSRKNLDFSYKNIPLNLTLTLCSSSLTILLEDITQTHSFKSEISVDNTPSTKVPLSFLKLIISISIENLNKSSINQGVLSQKASCKLYKLSEIQLFELFPKYLKKDFENLKQENEEISGENFLSGKGILLRVKIKNFKPGSNFDFKVQLPKITQNIQKNNQHQKSGLNFKKMLLEEQIMKTWQTLQREEN